MDDNRPSFESRLLESNRRYNQRSSTESMSNVIAEGESPTSEFEFHDSGYLESIQAEYRVSSPLAKQRQPSFGAPEDVKSMQPDSASSCSLRRSSAASDSDECEEQPLGSTEMSDDPFGVVHEGLPSFIRLGPVRGRYDNPEISAYGSLFEQSDPWSTIGLILGLEEAQTNKLLADEDVFEMNEDDWGCESLFGGPCQDDENHMSNDDILDIPWQNLVPGYESMPPIAALPARHSPLPFGYDDRDKEICPSIFEDLLVEQDELERSSSPLGPPYDAMLVDDGSDKTAIIELGDDIHQTCENLPIENDGEIVKTVLPELREVNGRFLGPSLFEDFDESE